MENSVQPKLGNREEFGHKRILFKWDSYIRRFPSSDPKKIKKKTKLINCKFFQRIGGPVFLIKLYSFRNETKN